MEIDAIWGKLNGMAGTPFDQGELVKTLLDVFKAGGGVSIDLDGGRFKIMRREGKFILRRDDLRPSTMPPRR